jgi:hypothetical protein
VSLSTLNLAIKAKDAERALAISDSLRHVPLRYTLRLALLLADKDHPRYEEEALHVLEQAISERKPQVLQVKKLADALAHVHHHFYGFWARSALVDVIGQLHRRSRPIETVFDSLAEEHQPPAKNQSSGGQGRRSARPCP